MEVLYWGPVNITRQVCSPAVFLLSFFSLFALLLDFEFLNLRIEMLT